MAAAVKAGASAWLQGQGQAGAGADADLARIQDPGAGAAELARIQDPGATGRGCLRPLVWPGPKTRIRDGCMCTE